jgi:DeoR family transcriptional regulator, fructose operon transcriptional repressor
MLVDQRRERIREAIENHGFVSLQQLVELLGASESTVRRDLDGFGEREAERPT